MPATQNGRKICSTCRADLDVARFGKNKRQPDGYQNVCKPCQQSYTRRWWHGRREDPDFVKSSNVYASGYQLKRRLAAYGLTVADHDRMAANGCAICNGPPTSGRRYALDHDHATGAFRGLLCGGCNTGIGMLGDDVDRMRSAIRYLDESRAAPELIWSDTEMS